MSKPAPRDSTAAAGRERVVAAVLLALAIAAGAWLRFAHLGNSPFWRDEASFAFMAVKPFGEFLDVLRRDVHAPLYFLLLRGWSALFGQSEYALRSLGAALSLLCIPALYVLARPALGAVWAAVAALLLAVNPGQLYAATDIMVYSLLTLLALGAAATFDRALASGRHAVWALHGLCLVGMAYTHMWGYYVWACLGAVAAWLLVAHVRRERRAPGWLRPYVFTNALAVVLTVPWLIQSFRQAGSRSMDHLVTTPGFFGMLTASFDWWFNSRQVIFVVGMLAVFLPLLLTHAYKRPADSTRFRTGLLIALFVAFGPQWLCFQVSYWKSHYVQRYTIECIPFFIVLVAGALSVMRPRALAVALAMFIAVWPLVPLDRDFDGVRHARYRRSAVPMLAERVAREARAGDVIFIYPEFYASTFNWYYRGDLPQICYPALGRVESVDWHTFAERVEDPDSFDAAVDAVHQRLAPGGRLWFIYQPAYAGKFGNIDYRDVYARLARHFDAAYRYVPEFAAVYEDADRDSPQYRGLEAVRLVVFQRQ